MNDPLPYRFIVTPLPTSDGGGYLIEFPELEGCISDGDTPEQALANGRDALACWLAAMHEAGKPVPPPALAEAAE